MIGRKYSGAVNTSFNLGVGYFFEPNAKILAEDIELNKELPEGQTLRHEEKTLHAFMVMASFAF